MWVRETESRSLQEEVLLIGPSLPSPWPPCIFIHFLFTLLFQPPSLIFIHFLFTLCLVIVGQRLSLEFILFYIIYQLSQCNPDILVILSGVVCHPSHPHFETGFHLVALAGL